MSSTSKKLVIFDFDGTIADTFELIISLFNQLAPDFQVEPLTPSAIKKLRDRPVSMALVDEFKLPKLKLPFMIHRFLKEFENQITTREPISGIEEALRVCRERGLSLGIVSSSQTPVLEKFLSQHQLRSYFAFVESSNNLFGKDKTIREVIAAQGLQPAECCYVGDEVRDVEAAKKAGVAIISVSWGFNSQQALTQAQPDALIEKPAQLLEAILGLPTVFEGVS